MCGIAGVFDLAAASTADDLRSRADAMAARVRHRGPDGAGIWVDAASGVALGHRRLKILDLSAAGAQPMVSGSGRFVVTYNGELYNAPELARELERSGTRFRGHSDTEVLVEAIDAWGLDALLRRANGMFAFALWDRHERQLHLVRDRLGEKPMYYAWQGRTVLFGSELKVLRAHPGFAADIDRDALALYFRFGYVPSPMSMLRGVRKLPAASVLTVSAADSSRPEPVAYWSALADLDAASSVGNASADPEAEVDRIEELLRDATRLRMRADVPLGAFLSGGIDSSTVVALMQAQASGSVSTFTIGSTAKTLDEAPAAAAVAAHLGTRHTELVVTPEDALAVIPRLPEVYDEPFADSSQVPTMLVAELARRDVTVSLSGDGGDEVFGGYERYRWVPSLARRLARVPSAVRRGAAWAAMAVPPRLWDGIVGPLPVRVRPRIPATKVAKLASVAPLDGAHAMYRRLVASWDDPGDVVIGAAPPRTIVDDPQLWQRADGDMVSVMMALDTATYLPDDILVKLDRATMCVGLEGRVPFLDHRVVEHVGRLPASLKIRDGHGKWLLRQVLRRYVPESLFDRPKTGFAVPIGAWLRGPLRDWADALLEPDRLRREGYLRPEPIAAAWHEHRRGRRDWDAQLWVVLMFEAWLEATTN